MAKEDAIDFKGILEDTKKAKQEMPIVEAEIHKAVLNNDANKALENTVKLRNLGAVPNQNLGKAVENLIISKGTPQQKVDYYVDCAPITNASCYKANEEVKALPKKTKAQICGTRTLRNRAGKEKMETMFNVSAKFNAKKESKTSSTVDRKKDSTARTR